MDIESRLNSYGRVAGPLVLGGILSVCTYGVRYLIEDDQPEPGWREGVAFIVGLVVGSDREATAQSIV